jgi:hypothetical protein
MNKSVELSICDTRGIRTSADPSAGICLHYWCFQILELPSARDLLDKMKLSLRQMALDRSSPGRAGCPWALGLRDLAGVPRHRTSRIH